MKNYKLISEFLGWEYTILDWDILMSALNKIESMGYHTLIKTSSFKRKNGHFIDHEVLIYDGQDCVIEEDFSLPTKFEAVESAVISFIEWYNEQNLNNESTTENKD